MSRQLAQTLALRQPAQFRDKTLITMDHVTQFVHNFSWPFAGLVFGLALLLLFKKPLAAFMYRARSIGKEGVKADPAPEAQLDKKESLAPPPEGGADLNRQIVQELMNVGSSPLLAERENQIKEALNTCGLKTEGDTASVLVRHLALTQNLLYWEQTYNLIFGSQIYLLRQLNQSYGLSQTLFVTGT